ncbi:hypothetical protein [Ralstonia pickettii]|uniref:hypothetical protein n=1 Tax=Ralstonia pickettii TaxID=329 RepID=UPI0027426016|nr:hypothetical protein [Ralstonia pickettii]
MAERAGVTARLAATNVQRCAGYCPTLEARRVPLTAKLEALEAEAKDIRRQQAAGDRAVTLRDALVVDAVTAGLAALLGTTDARVDLLSGLAFAAVLEGVACLLWTLTLWPRPTAPRVPPVVGPVTPGGCTVMASHVPEFGSHEQEAARHAPVKEPVTPLRGGKSLDPDVFQLSQAIAARLIRPTVVDIRRHLGCSQARAAALRRQLAVLDST